MPVERKLAAILSADVVGYSRLMAEEEAETIRTLGAYRTEITHLVEHHRGRVADFTGDNFLAEFPTALDAVEGAVEVQRVLKARNAGLPENRRMEFRIGVHLGDVAVEGERLYGDGVNIAARLEGLADAGGICVSAAVREQVENKIDLGFEDLGERAVKNIPKPVGVYRVTEGARSIAAPGPSRVIGPWAVVAAALVFVGLGLWLYQRGGTEPTPTPGPPLTSIAVLPFDDMSPKGNRAWLAEGIAEELIESLSRFSALRVPARTSTRILKQQQADIETIGEKLGVGSVVEGSVRPSGERLRITVQLIRVSDGYHLWSGRYDRELGDVLALQGEIAREVAEAITSELGIEQWGVLRGERYVPKDVRAWELVRKAQDLGFATFLEGDLRAARDYYLGAIEIDPDYAGAHSRFGLTNMILFNMYDPAEELISSAEEAGERALALDPTDIGAHELLAHLAFRLGEWDDAERRLTAAIEARPDAPNLREAYAILLSETGRLDQALVQQEKAVSLDPLHAIRHNFLAHMHLGAGEHDLAIRSWERTLELNPAQPGAAGSMAFAHHLSGEDGAALEALIQSLAPRFEAAVRGGFEAGGWTGACRAFRELAAREGRPCTVLPRNGAVFSAWSGDVDGVFQCLEQSIEERGYMYLGLRFLPWWDPYRDDPRFTALLRRMNLAE